LRIAGLGLTLEGADLWKVVEGADLSISIVTDGGGR